MSRSPIRQDKTCLNCSHVVDQRYCPNCGQENIETRKTFHHLFIHFFEDLTHYENAFWKTIRNLIFRPGSLTKVYLSGKRMSYLAPIRLYIFISFITFFLLSILPGSDSNNHLNIEPPKKAGIKYSWKKSTDSLNKVKQVSPDQPKHGMREAVLLGYTEKGLDSLQKYGRPEDRFPDRVYRMLKKIHKLKQEKSSEELFRAFTESFWHNFPKALFIYMPMFAFVLWVFQDKRRWYYFDHGIFTLHYFSFLLLMFLIDGLVSCLLGLFGNFWVVEVLQFLVSLAVLAYAFYYFFPAHHRFYGETRGVTVVKGAVIFIINSLLASVVLLALMVYSFLNIH